MIVIVIVPKKRGTREEQWASKDSSLPVSCGVAHYRSHTLRGTHTASSALGVIFKPDMGAIEYGGVGWAMQSGSEVVGCIRLEIRKIKSAPLPGRIHALTQWVCFHSGT